MVTQARFLRHFNEPVCNGLERNPSLGTGFNARFERYFIRCPCQLILKTGCTYNSITQPCVDARTGQKVGDAIYLPCARDIVPNHTGIITRRIKFSFILRGCQRSGVVGLLMNCEHTVRHFARKLYLTPLECRRPAGFARSNARNDVYNLIENNDVSTTLM